MGINNLEPLRCISFHSLHFTETLPKHFAFINSLKLFIKIYTNLYLLVYKAISHYYNSIEHCYLSYGSGYDGTKKAKR